MTPDGGVLITVHAAAAALFRTTQPTSEQVTRTAGLIASGILPGVRDAAGQWRTTAGHVAEFAARRYRQRERDGGPVESDVMLSGLYGDLVRDYLLALIFRRKARHATPWFRRAVVGGQIAIVALIGLLGVRLCLPANRNFERARRAIQEHLAQTVPENTELLSIRSLMPHEQGGIFEVEYRYTNHTGRRVETRRRFQVGPDHVREVFDPVAADDG